MHVYKTKDLERVLGIQATTVRALIRGKHILPRAVGGGRRSFTFQDLILMRAATALRAAGIPGYKITRTLRHLKLRLPPDEPLSAVSMAAVGKQIAIRRGTHSWDADSGQYHLTLEVVAAAAAIRPFGAAGARASELFDQGYVAEADDLPAAIAFYEQCLSLLPEHREARLNLGRLLHQGGQLEAARAVYCAAPAADSDTAFSLGVVLEDLDREAEAIGSYQRALELDSACIEAHYNLARLHDAAGRKDESLRHLIALRRLGASEAP